MFRSILMAGVVLLSAQGAFAVGAMPYDERDLSKADTAAVQDRQMEVKKVSNCAMAKMENEQCTMGEDCIRPSGVASKAKAQEKSTVR